MLVNLQEVLSYAEKNRCAIGAFNTPNLECIMAVLQNAETYRVPVIIAHAQVHESIMPLDTIGPIMVLCAKRAKVPVCVHLDHGESLDYIEKALELGFTSAMYDGSRLTFEENMENTLKAVRMVRKYGAGIEAEIGVMRSSSDSSEGSKGEKGIYTDPEIAKKFAEMTNVDALAASFGTVHGIYTEKPQLDFQRIKRIKELTRIPLVMHGGSGVSREDYITAIEKGIRKINYYTYMSREAVFAAKELLNGQEGVLYHDIALTAVEAMKKDSGKAMKVFYNIP
ncbi:class II fructose-bisphosphate aldolase [Mahella sp.]|uniref:class II fructose-bisphosphate aldolase n=1 Tax=Mahella sp. TaxID=2798721 RepID=UPI003434BA32|nr:ketose-bisphosphate aldolase [Mahella sp.]